MKLFAIAHMNNTIARTIEVYDDNGVAYVVKTFPSGRQIDWHCQPMAGLGAMTAAQWVANNQPAKRKGQTKWDWQLF